MGFIADIQEKYKTVSIVGMAKNAGKTTALNYLLEEAYDEGLRMGVTSTGRDGETSDLVFETDKPKVYLFEDTIVTVPEQLYGLAETSLEILKRTNCRTALGQVLLCRVARSGYVQIAGPGSIMEHKKLCEQMFDQGIDMIIIDGAIDRKSIADPATSDAIILSTGAVISRRIKNVVEETVHVVSVYKSPLVEDEKLRAILEKEDRDVFRILTIDKDYNVAQVPVRTALGAGPIVNDAIGEDTRFVYIPGAITERILDHISPAKLKQVTIVLPNPTKVFVGATRWQQLRKMGLHVQVLENIEVAAVTVNPFSPHGYSFDRDELLNAVKEALPGLPVVDVRVGGLDL